MCATSEALPGKDSFPYTHDRCCPIKTRTDIFWLLLYYFTLTTTNFLDLIFPVLIKLILFIKSRKNVKQSGCFSLSAKCCFTLKITLTHGSYSAQPNSFLLSCISVRRGTVSVCERQLASVSLALVGKIEHQTKIKITDGTLCGKDVSTTWALIKYQFSIKEVFYMGYDMQQRSPVGI